MRKDISIDWATILLWLLLVGMGWLNVYSTSATEGLENLDLTSHHGKQLLFIGVSAVLGIIILMLDTKFMEFISYASYGLGIFLLVLVLLIAKVTHGASSWISLGAFNLQPSEFAKVATLMALSKFMSRFNYSMSKPSDALISAGLILVPMLLIVLQNDMGSALVFLALILMFYREGLHPLILVSLILTGIVGALTIFMDEVPGYQFYIIGGLVILTLASLALLKWRLIVPHIVAFIFLSLMVISIGLVTKSYQRMRFKVLLLDEDKLAKNDVAQKYMYNLRESKVAIGSGGLFGKGFGEGTHTKGDFVPEEHTDFIFCVVGEEHGFVGASLVLIVYFLFLSRLLYLAENSKSKYARIYGYGVVSVLFFHLVINIGMTIGLVPTVGIPLPFFSYGGSSMIAFSIMTFVLVNHYSYRVNILGG